VAHPQRGFGQGHHLELEIAKEVQHAWTARRQTYGDKEERLPVLWQFQHTASASVARARLEMWTSEALAYREVAVRHNIGFTRAMSAQDEGA
jgi:hypothetical protein